MTTYIPCPTCKEIEAVSGRLCRTCEINAWLTSLSKRERLQLIWYLVRGLKQAVVHEGGNR